METLSIAGRGDRHAYPTTVVRVLMTGGWSALIPLVVLALDWRLRGFHAMPFGCAMMMIVVFLPMAISDATSGSEDLVLLLRGGRP